MAILQVLLTLNNYGVWSFVPARYAVPAQMAAAGVYALGRGWAKSTKGYDALARRDPALTHPTAPPARR